MTTEDTSTQISTTAETTAQPGAPKAKKPIDMSLLDAAIARAKEKQTESGSGSAKEPKAKKEKAPKAEKPAKEKKEKPAKGPAHLAKVEAAGAHLPALSAEGTAICTEIDKGSFTSGDLSAIAQHLIHRARVMSTSAAVTATKPEVGARVVVRSGQGGAAKYVGHEGRLVEVRNIRCFADIFDSTGALVKRALYLFISDVEVISPPEVEAPPASTVQPAGTAAAAEEAQAAPEAPTETAPEATGTEG